jgi:hypothetical protein
MQLTPAGKRVVLDIVLVVALALVIRVGVFILVPALASGGASLSHGNTSDSWVRWDAVHYLQIAQYGYLPHEGRSEEERAFQSRFPPMYPLAVGVLNRISGLPYGQAGNILAIAAAALASVLLFRLCVLEGFDRRQSYFSVILLHSFPPAFILNSAFSESLCLCFILLFFIALHHSRFLPASLYIALAYLTRSQGLLLYASLLYGFYVWWKNANQARHQWSPYLALLVPGLVFVGHQLMIKYHIGSPGYFRADEFSVHFNAIPLLDQIRTLSGLVGQSIHLEPGTAATAHVVAGLFFIYAAMLFPLSAFRLRAVHSIFFATFMVVYMFYGHNISGPRYMLGVPQMFMSPALLQRLRFLLWPIVMISFGLQIFLAWLFVKGYWVF